MDSLSRTQRGEAAGVFELGVLLRRRLLRRADPLPRGESVAVVFVDAEVLELCLAVRERETVQCQLELCFRPENGRVVSRAGSGAVTRGGEA